MIATQNANKMNKSIYVTNQQNSSLSSHSLEDVHRHAKVIFKEKLVEAIRSKAGKQQISSSLEQLLLIAEKIIDSFPNHDFATVISNLRRNLKENNETAKQRPNRCQSYPFILLSKASHSLDFSYLSAQKLPLIPKEDPPKYGVNGSLYYDMTISLEKYSTQLQIMRWNEQRLLVDVYCAKGYGINYFRQAINDQNCVYSKDRYKTAIGTILRLGFRNIEDFIKLKMRRDASALRKIDLKALLPPLLNIQHYLQQKYCETFYRCLKVSFCIETQPALDEEVLQFYRQLVRIIRGQKFESIVDSVISPEEQARIQSKVFEHDQLWTPQLQLQFARIYRIKKSFSKLKQELQAKYPHIPNQYFDYCRIRARSDKLFAVAMRKVNKYLQDCGEGNYVFALSDRLKKTVSRSPIAADIRTNLCSIILDEDITINFVREIAEKIYKMAQERNRKSLGQKKVEGNLGKDTRQQSAKQKKMPLVKREHIPMPQKPIKIQQNYFFDSQEQIEQQPKVQQSFQLDKIIKKQLQSMKSIKTRC